MSKLQIVIRLVVPSIVLSILGFCPLEATPVTWTLVNVTFHEGLPAIGPGGPITASGTFTYDADIQTMLSWDITVAGSSDPTVNFAYTPASSFIPSLYTHLQTSVRFVVSLPGNPPMNPSGADPFGPQSALLDLEFSNSPGNQGLTNAGGLIPVVTGGTQIANIFTNARYGVETGCVTSTSDSCSRVPEPSSMLLVAFGSAVIFRKQVVKVIVTPDKLVNIVVK